MPEVDLSAIRDAPMAARRPVTPPTTASKAVIGSRVDATFAAALIPVGQALLSGVLVGGVYGLISIGFSLAFGVMRIVNFAHGDLVMYGMYVGVVASTGFGVDPLYAIPLSSC